MGDQFLRIVRFKTVLTSGAGEAAIPGIVGLKDYTGLRTQFKISKTSESAPNKGTIKIFNLNQASRTELERDDLKVILEAGYPGGVEELFKGDVAKVSSVKVAPDWITTLECGDGEKSLRVKHIDKSWGAGTPFSAIIGQALLGLGLTQGPNVPVGADIAIGGFSFSGPIKRLMDLMAKRFGFEWNVQNETVQISMDGVPTLDVPVIINPRTGVIGNIIKREKGIEFKTLLNPKIKPGITISVLESIISAGNYKCRKVDFDGDSHAGPFFATVEAEPI